MSTIFSARQVCELALQRVGAYPLSDSGADGDALDRALSWLDVVMAEIAGHQRAFWLVPATLTLSLTGGKKTYVLLDDLTSPPELGIQFPIDASLVKSDGNRIPIDIVTREEYEDVTNKDTSGTPDKVYIDRLAEPTLTIHPVPGTGVTGHSIELVVQTYAPAFHETSGEVATQLRAAWQKWAVEAVAYEIGSGPVRVLETSRLDRIKQDRNTTERRLLAFENRQHATSSGRTVAKDF